MKKVFFVFNDLNGGITEESLWAEPIENGYFKVGNIPFFAPNIALNDIIKVENDEGVLYFDELIQASGHSTVQILFFKTDQIDSVLATLVQEGCRWEGFKNKPYFSLDIPPSTSYQDIKHFLEICFNEGILDYKEACLAQKTDEI